MNWPEAFAAVGVAACVTFLICYMMWIAGRP